MAKKAPDPTPPKETSAASTGTNVSTAIANAYLGNVSEYTPDGSTRVQKTGSQSIYDPYTGVSYDIPTFTRTTSLSPAQQAIKDQRDQASLNLATLGANQSGRVDGLLSNPFDISGLPSAGNAGGIRDVSLGRVGSGPELATSYNNDYSADRQRVEQALLDRIRPQQERDLQALQSQLASQGVRLGSAAYSAAMDDYNRSLNDARFGAIAAGGQEQSRLAGLAAQEASFGNSALQQMYANRLQGLGADNQSSISEANADAAKFGAENAARSQALQEAFAVRNQPLNEITALMSGGQVAQPQFMGAHMPTIPTTDNAAIIANYDRQRAENAQADAQFAQSIFGSILGFGKALVTSDRRAKTGIKKVGKTFDGQNIYQYRYKSGGPIRMGLMAQEVEKRRPDAVTEIGGLKAVNYGRALRGARK